MLVYQKVEFSCFHLFFFYIFFCHGKFEVGNAKIILESEPLENAPGRLLCWAWRFDEFSSEKFGEHISGMGIDPNRWRMNSE